MGFPIKKRIDTSNMNDGHLSSGLDLLSAAVDSRPLLASSMGQGGVGLGHSSLTHTSDDAMTSSTNSDSEDFSFVLSTPTSQVSKAMAKSSESTSKRAKAFPEVLMDIISDPDNAPIISWLPHGRCFAIHDQGEFTSTILHKHFRRVIFRSFARKLNRWGFRSVKRSVSGFDSTFEHTHFRRDQPELVSKMSCKSNPARNPSLTLAMRSNEKQPAATTNTDTSAHGLSRSPSPSSVSSASVQAAPQVPQVSPSFVNRISGSIHHNEHQFLDTELLLIQELHHRQIRRQALLQLAQQMPDADIVAQYVADKRRLILSRMQQFGSDEYVHMSGL